ncbi:MAG: histone H1 [Acidobacteriales bacterium]|nr:histone H1 [Terriglobales bacterium]
MAKSDFFQNAKRIVEQAIGEQMDGSPLSGNRTTALQADRLKPAPPKDRLAVELGRRGGIKGGKARAEKLSAEKLSKIGKKGATARWHSAKPKP